ncbi:hemin-degrading factor [Echinicola sp. CAU 1574]|uniref:Hemin-degrading factor n=1 Tax=Echinicola arenosa TaxID=2774144 RepID=A0ABR9APA2_9BACT|nr:ChuX/HutX family heme-like substrate-binding protein [Echinicola arenosa]MBD8490617.1 hemin-degrading factor [Echinicola arenosa]
MNTIVKDNELKEKYKNFKAKNPGIRIREAAKQLGVSEAELLATSIGEGVVLLKGNWADFILQCRDLGRVLALTRSEGCVLEHKGTFQKISIHGTSPNQIATVIGPIEQRIFFSNWKFGFSAEIQGARGPMKSFQFFDKAGDAILKIYMQKESNLEVFEQLTQAYKALDQSAVLDMETIPGPEYAKEVNAAAFREDWENMKDTHDFFGMLKKYKIHRLEALKLIGEKWAYPVEKLVVRNILETASAKKLPIMIFAGNRGNIQIHQGKVRTTRQLDNWFNVMDPDFVMHLNEDTIDSAWVVHKNTTDGLVSSVELYDQAGELIAQYFGLRKPGIPQNVSWKNLIDNLPRI